MICHRFNDAYYGDEALISSERNTLCVPWSEDVALERHTRCVVRSQAVVREAVEAAIGKPIAADQPLMAAGLNSLGATELQEGLSETLGLSLPPTLIFDYPTITALVAHLSALAAGQADTAQAALTELQFSRRSIGSNMATIIGIAGRLL